MSAASQYCIDPEQIDPDSARQVMRQVIKDVQGDVLVSYPRHNFRTTSDLFNAKGGGAFGLYLSRLHHHAAAYEPLDPAVAAALDRVRGEIKACAFAMRRVYNAPLAMSLTQMFTAYKSGLGTFNNQIRLRQLQSSVRSNRLICAGLELQKDVFIPAYLR